MGYEWRVALAFTVWAVQAGMMLWWIARLNRRCRKLCELLEERGVELISLEQRAKRLVGALASANSRNAELKAQLAEIQKMVEAASGRSRFPAAVSCECRGFGYAPEMGPAVDGHHPNCPKVSDAVSR